ncbi:hypothetical protein Scep_030760 [Stephania cephalantha]|uniref:J domain-containing protein n=1 Tax=Stephania cephalantha TaxID=152367 RepID=A0AAP0E091_9MAGN
MVTVAAVKHPSLTALQLHPDKNSHTKAEVAFKLVSEAYACLSDEAKRRVFDAQRWNNSCAECKGVPGNSTGSNSAVVLNSRILRRMKEVRDRFREEVRIIENCLKTKKAFCEESPVFKPSNNPHQRSQNYLRPDDLQYLRASSVKSHMTGSRYMFDHSSGCYESLTFEIRSESRSFRNPSTRFSSKCKVH